MQRPLPSSPRQAMAFTLVELLVVIGIIALLVAMLLPSLKAARQSAINIQCQANMREIGMAVRGFASENGDRSPGSAQGASSVSWVNILNAEWFSRKGQFFIPRLGASDKGRQLSCPNIVPKYAANGSMVNRQYALNGMLVGGDQGAYSPPLFDDDSRYGGPLGKAVIPATSRDPAYKNYRLGAKLGGFASPSTKFMLLETERSDTIGAHFPYDDKPTTWSLGDDVDYPAYSGAGGKFSFRHSKFRRMNALFVDGHIESISSQDELNTKRRYTNLKVIKPI